MLVISFFTLKLKIDLNLLLLVAYNRHFWNTYLLTNPIIYKSPLFRPKSPNYKIIFYLKKIN